MKIWNRLDNFLAWIAGYKDADKTMDPRNPREYWLKQIAENGGSGSGYTVTEERTVVIPEQTVETVAESGGNANAVLDLADGVTTPPASMTVTFNGVEYNLAGVENGPVVIYESQTFAVRIGQSIGGLEARVITITAQTVTIKAESVTETVEVSEDFKKAAESALGTLDDIYDLELVYRESQGDYSAEIPGNGMPYENMNALLDSYKAFYFYIPTTSDLGLRVFVDCINRSPAGVFMSGSYIENGTLSVYSGSMNSRNTGLFITKTDYTLTPAT